MSGEFSILDQGYQVDGGLVQYQWFKLASPQGGSAYRAVALRELTYLPIETRDDPDMLGKQWAALRGLYNANADFLFTAFGIFAPLRLGVVQCYGAAAEGPDQSTTIREALYRLGAVEATLANFPQSRTAVPDLARVELLTDRLRRLPKVLALLGHPDPRLAKKGLGRDGAMGVADDEFATQQAENLLRGLARINQDFVFLVTAAHIARPRLSDALVRMAQVASNAASRQRGSINVGFSMAIPIATALSSALSANNGHATSAGHSTAETVNEGWSQSAGESWGHSVGQSASHGVGHTESSAVTNTTGVAHGVTESTGWGHTASSADTVSGAESSTWGHTDSQASSVSGAASVSSAHTVSSGHAVSSAETVSGATTHSTSTGVTHTAGSSWGATTGSSSGWSEGTTQSAGETVGTSSGMSMGVNHGATQSSGTGHTVSAGTSETASAGTTQAEALGSTTTESHGGTFTGSVGIASRGETAATSAGASVVNTAGSSASQASGTTTGVADAVNQSTGSSTGLSMGVQSGASQSASTGTATSAGTSGATSQSSSVGGSSATSTSSSSGVAHTAGWASSHGETYSTGAANTTGHASSAGWSRSAGTADSVGGGRSAGWAKTAGVANSVTGGRAVSESVSRSTSVAHGVADSESWGQSVSEGWSTGRSVAQGVSAGRSRGAGESVAEGTSWGGGRGMSNALSMGLVPGVSIGRGWQTEDDVAIRLTELTRGLEAVLNAANVEGGFMTTALLLATEAGERAAQALAPQAFHGPNVPTPVATRPAPDSLRRHALAFRPSLAPDASNPFGIDLLWTQWSTLLTPAMLAAYTAPNLFEEGTAVTIQDKLPPLAFYPELPGEAVLGHQVSGETGDLTTAPLRLSREAHFHTAFCGDTGYGKSVAALRMAYETTLHWQLKTIVLDFGMGWRQLLNAPGLAGHVEIRQLSPGGVRPLRWNPLQIGRNILPEVQWRAFSDIFGTIAQLGAKRQIHELREILRRVYLDAGVLVDDPECRADPAWGVVRPAEATVAGQPAGTALGALDRLTRQRLAVERSRYVGLAQVYQRIEQELKGIPARDIRRSILEGINFRLQPLVQGESALQYAADPHAIDINAIVPGDWGVAVLEGGAFLDEFSKAFLLGWAAWQLYTDAVVLRTRSNVTRPAHLQIFFEEANKMLAGLDAKAEGEDGGGASVADQFANMWRDSRKYGIWLHLVTQSPSLIPPGIMSSCNNLFAAQLKNSKDRDAVIAAFARSEKGFVDEPWRRFLASLPVGRSVVKLGYTTERARLEPVYMRPLMLTVPEPSDAELVAALGPINL